MVSPNPYPPGDVQNNSPGALAAQPPPLNPFKLFSGFEVGQPNSFYLSGDTTFQQFQNDAQTAVNAAKYLLNGYVPVSFIEFYDADIASNFTFPALDGTMSPGSLHVNQPVSANKVP